MWNLLETKSRTTSHAASLGTRWWETAPKEAQGDITPGRSTKENSVKCIWKSREGGNSLVSDPLLIVSAQWWFRLIRFFPPRSSPFPWYLIQIPALNSQAGKARQYNKESLLFPSSHGCQSQPCLYLQRAALSSVSILALCRSTALASSHHFTFLISCQLHPGFPSFGVILCKERSLTHTQIQHS